MAYRPKPEEFLPADQGALFEAFVRRPKSGRRVQPGDQGDITIEVPQDGEPYYAADDSARGIYGDDRTISVEALRALTDAAQDATRKNRAAQRGRHSARDPETHRYEDPRVIPGKVLPPSDGLGGLPLAVTDSNPESVSERTDVLNEEADVFAANNPQIGEEEYRPVKEVIARTAEQMGLNRQIYFVDVDAEGFRGDEKIKTVLVDERAGFMPMTHEEKDMAFQVLTSDFHDSSDREKASMRIQKMRSYFETARRDAQALAWLEEVVDAVDTPEVTLEEAVSRTGAEDSEMAFLAVVSLFRSMDLQALLSGKEEFTFRPMAARTDPSERALTDKNGATYDSYTAAFLFDTRDSRVSKQYAEIRARVLGQYKESSVGSIKREVSLALLNQRRRLDFWQRYLGMLDAKAP